MNICKGLSVTNDFIGVLCADFDVFQHLAHSSQCLTCRFLSISSSAREMIAESSYTFCKILGAMKQVYNMRL